MVMYMKHTIFKDGKWVAVEINPISPVTSQIKQTIEPKTETNNKEKLSIDFEVYKKTKLVYGFEEKFLAHEGVKTGSKAIIKNNQYVNIVGSHYKLIPNEDVLSIVTNIAINKGLQMKPMNYDWRLYCILSDQQHGVGIIVSNSVDASVALRCDAMISNIGNTYTILVGKKIRNIYRRHSANLKINDLDKEISNILRSAIEYKEVLGKLKDYDITEYIAPLRELFKANLPEIYYRGLLNSFYIGKPETVLSVYETIAQRIWNKNTDMKTKMTLYHKLNDCILSIGIIDSL